MEANKEVFMRYNILGDSDCPLVNIELFKGEKVKIAGYNPRFSMKIYLITYLK